MFKRMEQVSQNWNGSVLVSFRVFSKFLRVFVGEFLMVFGVFLVLLTLETARVFW